MKSAWHATGIILTSVVLNLFFILTEVSGQEKLRRSIPDDNDFFHGIIYEEEETVASEELQSAIDEWKENPVPINSDDISVFVDYQLISMYQLNKLKEYRMKYGDLLSVYELKNIDGWDLLTARKISALSTAVNDPLFTSFKTRQPGRLHQSLTLKTSFNLQNRKGYLVEPDGDSAGSGPYYQGSPLRMSLRYDLSWSDKCLAGLRMEKDAGEPFLVPAKLFGHGIKMPDHLSAFVEIHPKGPFRSILLGDYRLQFGYGMNFSGGTGFSANRQGLTYPLHRLRANTSISESGYLRGVAFLASMGRISVTGFFSSLNIDGTSILADSLTGKPVTFSGISHSGLHRSLTELEKRKNIREMIYGGHLVFMNNWLKLGLILYYNSFSARMDLKDEPYARYDFSGTSNLISGFTAAAWFRNLRLVTEISMSRNMGFAALAGVEVFPAPGTAFSLIFRHFDKTYQNLHGTGYTSAGKTNGETGIQALLRMEIPMGWYIRMIADFSVSPWVVYQLNAPSHRWTSVILSEKPFQNRSALMISLRYQKELTEPVQYDARITHPVYYSKTNIRMECRISPVEILTFKTRLEGVSFKTTGQENQHGWLIFQDIGYKSDRLPVDLWLRIGYFETQAYETRIYAYENDLLYDFSSFMHDGKGLRAAIMISFTPVKWLDFWIRFSTVQYADRVVIGTGWDEVQGNRLNEGEVQIRIRMPGQ